MDDLRNPMTLKSLKKNIFRDHRLDLIKKECEDIIDEVSSIQAGQTISEFEDSILYIKAARHGIDIQLDHLDVSLRHHYEDALDGHS